MIRDVERNLTGQMAESEERLLSAVRGIEVRREDFDSLGPTCTNSLHA